MLCLIMFWTNFKRTSSEKHLKTEISGQGCVCFHEQRREAGRERRAYKWKVGVGWWSAVVFSSPGASRTGKINNTALAFGVGSSSMMGSSLTHLCPVEGKSILASLFAKPKTDCPIIA